MSDSTNYFVIKRNGSKESVSFDRILKRIRIIVESKQLKISHGEMTQRVIERIHPDISSAQIDEIVADEAIQMSINHPDYGILAKMVAISSLHKNTSDSFTNVIKMLYKNTNELGQPAPLITDSIFQFVKKNSAVLNKMCDYSRDYNYDYFGFKTLYSRYLFRVQGKVIERPQHMWMRVAIAIHHHHPTHMEDIENTYNALSRGYYTHATPTLYNAGTPHGQLASCFLLPMEDDSIKGIYHTLGDCANISKHAGGIGLSIHNIRASGTYIAGSNGHSNGIVPMLRVFNETARYVDQGGGKRKGSFAIYIEPWHADIESFLELRKNHGDENMRARDLFYALWISDLFMKRVIMDETWTLMCPKKCPGLSDLCGEEFQQLYEQYEREGRGNKTISARKLWGYILDSQIETGTPYMLYKDAANRKSNQQNLGTIYSSNLCTEIIQYSNQEETAVCNLASIALPKFVKKVFNAETGQTDITYDFDHLHDITKLVVYNMEKVIDVNYYPDEKTRRSNLLHRPMGVGVQGLADLFIEMRIPFESDKAKLLNRQIFETMYHAALEMSCELAQKYGPYSSYTNSPISKGIFQFNMWKKPRVVEMKNGDPSRRLIETDEPYYRDSDLKYDWAPLRAKIAEHGVRHSLLLTVMPTASTSQILGFTECIEPITSNIYARTTLSGTFRVINEFMIRDLIQLGLWSKRMKERIIQDGGSIQMITEIPSYLREIYKTVWEMDMKNIIEMSADRGVFICQSQSLNIWVEDPDYKQLTSIHFAGWKMGLKTGMYYLRRKARSRAQQFTIEPTLIKKNTIPMAESQEEVCEMCSA